MNKADEYKTILNWLAVEPDENLIVPYVQEHKHLLNETELKDLRKKFAYKRDNGHKAYVRNVIFGNYGGEANLIYSDLLERNVLVQVERVVVEGGIELTTEEWKDEDPIAVKLLVAARSAFPEAKYVN